MVYIILRVDGLYYLSSWWSILSCVLMVYIILRVDGLYNLACW